MLKLIESMTAYDMFLIFSWILFCMSCGIPFGGLPGIICAEGN